VATIKTILNIISSKVKNQIGGRRQLIVRPAIVIGFLIPRPLETQFRTQLHGGANPMTPHDRVL
jgi:hypothetical protein